MAIGKYLSLDDFYSVENLDRLVRRHGGIDVRPIEPPMQPERKDERVYHVLDATLIAEIKNDPIRGLVVPRIVTYASDEKKIRNIEGLINGDIRQIATSIH